MNQLIIGLGNPGIEYELTRHNIGFIAVDSLAQKWQISLSQKFKGLFGEYSVHGNHTRILKPLTYMNRSGEAVLACSAFFKIAPADILVVHDDLDLAYGSLTFKSAGGHGGHNGLRSIISLLGTDQFSRLRLGIGRPQGKMAPSSYVLARYDQEQEDVLEDFITLAVEAMGKFAQDGFQIAANAFSRRSIATRISNS